MSFVSSFRHRNHVEAQALTSEFLLRLLDARSGIDLQDGTAWERSIIRKLSRSYAAGSGTRARLMFPRISAREFHSFSSSQASRSVRTLRRWPGPLRRIADTICVTWA